MPTTPRGLPYPLPTDAARGPLGFQNLAEAIEAMLNSPLVLGSTLRASSATLDGSGGVLLDLRNTSGGLDLKRSRLVNVGGHTALEARDDTNAAQTHEGFRMDHVTGVVDFPNGLTGTDLTLTDDLNVGDDLGVGGSLSVVSGIDGSGGSPANFPSGLTGRRMDSPYFRAHLSTAQSYSTGSTVVFNSETDPNGWYDPATGIFLPTLAGMYRVSWAVTLSLALGVDKQMYTRLVGSGPPGAHGGVVFQSAATQPPASGGSVLLPFNGTTDSTHVIVGHDNGGSVALNVTAGYCHFEADYLGA